MSIINIHYVQCEICNCTFKKRGLAAHQRTCASHLHRDNKAMDVASLPSAVASARDLNASDPQSAPSITPVTWQKLHALLWNPQQLLWGLVLCWVANKLIASFFQNVVVDSFDSALEATTAKYLEMYQNLTANTTVVTVDNEGKTPFG
jgi:hypothetical protein